MARCSRVSGAASLRGAREGVAALEFALCAPILILTGAASLGLASWTRMQVGNAARAGAAYAVNHVYNLASVATAAQSATALSSVIVTSAEATQSCTDPASGRITGANGATVCPGTGSPPGDYVTVTTQIPYSFMMPIPGVADVKTLNGNAVTRIR